MGANMIASTVRGEAAPSAAAVAASETTLAGGAKVIRDLGAQSLEVEIGNELVAARVAFSCLVRPIAGDRVLLSRGADGVFVLAVLERLVPDSATLALPTRGALTIEAEGVSLAARGAVSIEAHSVSVRSGAFRVVADNLTLFGRLATWVAEHLRVSAKSHETAVDTLTVKALDRVAIVERADVLHAASVSQTIDGVSVTSAPAVVIATSEDLRLDGQRVTVG